MRLHTSLMALVFCGLLWGCTPTADFSVSPTRGDAPLKVTFEGTSSVIVLGVNIAALAPVTGRSWDFGDLSETEGEGEGEEQDSDQEVSHTYYEEGTYTVAMTVSNFFGSTTETKENRISVGNPVEFTVDVSSGEAPLTVRFRDETDLSNASSDPIDTWLWDFGDGGSSTVQNPNHTYDNPGTYTASLTITSESGKFTGSAEQDIVVSQEREFSVDFDVNRNTGEVPFEVQFQNISIIIGVDEEVSYEWQFGDGSTSTEKSPSHTYETTGTFTVTLTASTTAQTAAKIEEDYITANPSVKFSASATEGPAPFTVQFTDESDAGGIDIDSWTWDFGDGASEGQEQHPEHTYENEGTYSVRLSIETLDGTFTEDAVSLITVTAPIEEGETTDGETTQEAETGADGEPAAEGEPGEDGEAPEEGEAPAPGEPQARFTANATNGTAPLSVVFSDLSVPGNAPITSWLWDFGDNGLSTLQHPTHVYNEGGLYTVSLTIKTSEAQDLATKTDYILVNALPTAAFAADTLSGAAPLTVQFSNDSEAGTHPITEYLWTFGDGDLQRAETASHTYTHAGRYDVSLTATSQVGPHTRTIEDYIAVGTLATVDFLGEPRSGPAPLTVQFTDLSTPGDDPITAWDWNISGLGYPTEQNPRIVFTEPGDYNVMLSVVTDVGDPSLSSKWRGDYIVVTE